MFFARKQKTIYGGYTLCLNMIELELKEWGNSIGVILPAERLKQLGLKKGDKIEIHIKKKRIDGFGICKKAQSFMEESDSDKF